jgi:subtilisin family serine protease
MRKFLITSISILCITLLAHMPLMASVDIPREDVSKRVIPEHYIVVLQDIAVKSVPDVANEMAKTHGLTMRHIYRHALKGFSARIPDHKLEILKKDKRVKRVDPDRIVYAMGKPPGKGKPGGGETAPQLQTLPTGINRIDAEENKTNRPVDVDIAVIDTGIDLDHPDLNVVGNVTFVKSKNGDDDNGHGTHVAGTAAAKDNSIGVVGVAPGARLWAVKVLDRRGSGSWSGVIAGIDWVTARAGQIEVANMSLGGSGSDTESAMRMAIENSVLAGVTYVVAAGNEGEDAQDSVPAAYDFVITVSSIADSDGEPGGNGASTTYGADDTFATFSNYGADVDLAAPGVNIYSCWKKGGYNTISGTSMAAPHVTGAAALYISNNPNISPNDVSSHLKTTGENNGFTGDPDSYSEPLVNASGL